MDYEDSRFLATTPSIMPSNEARDRLHAIMTSDMAEAIEQIGQTLEACNTKKTRLLNQLDEVFRAVEAVRNECGCIDTTIASKVLHLNKLATQIVQQMALINIPDPPPPPEPIPPPTVEIDLTAIHERLNGLDHIITNLTKLILEKEETVLYVVNKRPGNGDLTTSVHSPIRSADRIYSGITNDREEQIHDQMTKLQKLVRNIQNDGSNRSKEFRQHKVHLNHQRSKQLPYVVPSFIDEEDSIHSNGLQNGHHQINNNDEDETSPDSEQTTVGPCTLCLQERTEEMTTKRSSSRRSVTSSHYTDQSHSLATAPTGGGVDGVSGHSRGLGEALASNGTEIIYYDYEQETICTTGGEESSIKFHHGLVVDLYWWALNNEWLILSEQGLYRWKVGDTDYHDAYEFSNGEIGFRRIAVTSTSIFCLFRYSLMLLELSNSMQMKRLHALAPPDTSYRKLADISIRKMVRSDGSEEDILGLIWFGSGSGILLEERFVTHQANNSHERLFRHVAVREGRYARLASYEDGHAWLISNTGANVFWIVDNTNVIVGRWEATAIWVEINNGIPINAVGSTDDTVCIRLQDGKLQYLESEH